jgi:hypothetical protein
MCMAGPTQHSACGMQQLFCLVRVAMPCYSLLKHLGPSTCYLNMYVLHPEITFICNARLSPAFLQVAVNSCTGLFIPPI